MYPLFIVFVFGIFFVLFCFVLFCFFFFFFFWGGGGGGVKQEDSDAARADYNKSVSVFPCFVLFLGGETDKKVMPPEQNATKMYPFFFFLFFFFVFFCFVFWGETDKTVVPPEKIVI